MTRGTTEQDVSEVSSVDVRSNRDHSLRNTYSAQLSSNERSASITSLLSLSSNSISNFSFNFECEQTAAEVESICMEAYQSHWRQIQSVFNKYSTVNKALRSSSSNFANNASYPNEDDLNSVLNNFQSMVLLLSNEPPPPLNAVCVLQDDSTESSPIRFLDTSTQAELRGPILNLTISAQILEKTVEWCALNCGNHADHVKVELLNNFRTLLSHSKQLILVHDSIAKSLLNLINDCRAYRSSTVEPVLLKLLYDLCTLFYNQPQVM